MEREYFEPSDYIVETYKDYEIIATNRFGSTQYIVYDTNGISRGIPLLSIGNARLWIDMLIDKGHPKHYHVIGKHIVTRNDYGQTFKYDIAPMLNYGKHTLDELMQHITENTITLENGDTITYTL